jgi:hypothetical protein
LNKNYIADILRLGRIESIDSLDLDSEWWGLFDKGEGKWRLEKTKIQSIAVHNPMVDEEGEMSSFEITTSKKEAYLLLWSNLDFLAERDVEQIKIEKNEIYPGEDIEFQFHRADYRIYAFGEDGEFGDIKNYELRISKNAGQHEPDQLITDHQYFDGTMLSILFVGDIDGDKIPDMIIEDSHKYSYSKPVLFLSRPTSESRIFIKIGERSFYSC